MTTTTRPPATGTRRRWLGLGLIATAQFVAIMDTSIVGVALPDMQVALGFTSETLTWVFNAYVIAFGGLLLLGGRLADVFGARRVFVAGWLTLLGGSWIAGAATTTTVEIVGRAVQGAGSALIAPAALSLLIALFGGTKDLPKAFAVYGAAAPLGGTAGVFLGGVLTEFASWQWVLYVTIPIAALVIALTPLALPRVAGQPGGRIGWLSAALATTGLASLVFGVVRGPEAGWTSGDVLLSVFGGLVLMGLFLLVQKIARQPLVRLGLFREPQLGAANIAQLLLGAAWVPMWFFLNLYLQEVLGAGAFLAGAALLPMTLLIVFGMVALAPRLLARFGVRTLVVSGLLVLALGLGWLALVRPEGSYVVDVLGGSLLAALGMSLAFVPSLGTAISAAPMQESGVASGLVNTSYQVGSAVGLAAITAVVASTIGGESSPAALTSGYSAGFLVAAIVALVGAGIAAATFSRPTAETSTATAG